MHKRAAIITYWNTDDNYGTVLQNFALQKFLINNDIEPTTIKDNLFSNQSLKEKLIRNLREKGVINVLFKILSLPISRLQIIKNKKINKARNFDNFRSTYIKYTDNTYNDYKQLESEQSFYDIYIAGSDQIWNFGKYDVNDLENLFKTVFLNFGKDNSIKISCSASFGNPLFSEEVNKKVFSYLSKFDFISIREQKGVDYCKSLGIKNAVIQYDPTFLHSADFYHNLCNNVRIEKSKYILVYLLNNNSEFSFLSLKKWAKKNNLKIIYVNGNLFVPKIILTKVIYPTIQEWLSLIENAEYILTNSFHGTVFSIIFNKQFLSIKQTKKFHTLNIRIENLLSFFQLTERICHNNFDAFENKIDYSRINPMLDNIRKASPFVKYIEKIND